MQITKRDNTKETVKLEKITRRINRQSKDLKNVDSIAVAQKVIQGLYDGVTSSELDKLATETAYALSVKHPEYDKLALRLAVSALHKETKSSFSEVIEDLYNNVTDANGNKKSLIDKKVYMFIKKNKHLLDSMIDHDKDFDFDYFGFKTLERSYLWKINGKIVERPQFMWARVACGIHYADNDIEACINTYKVLSSKVATHATPTLFNAASTKAQLSSCFLVATKDDSINGIYDTLKECALISQSAGGIGFYIHQIRSKGSPVYGTGGTSNGIVPALRNFNETARYVDQCLTGDSKILTQNGYKNISDLEINDKVKTLNSFSNIKNKKEFNIDEEIVEIKTSSGSIKVTKNHPVLVVRNCENLSDEQIKQKLLNKFINPEWVEAEKLLVTDRIISHE
jgi:ribonucleoside-diphosphate reductase alpha chain